MVESAGRAQELTMKLAAVITPELPRIVAIAGTAYAMDGAEAVLGSVRQRWMNMACKREAGTTPTTEAMLGKRKRHVMACFPHGR
jgi:hypothetical protein